MAKIETLPGRDCGPCTVCCTVKPISTGGLVKAPGVACAHCSAGGCAIYETRYDICRGYLCGWKWAPFIAEDLRPDRSGLLFDIEQAPVDGYIGEVTILAFRDSKDFARGRTPDLIAALIQRGVSVQLSRPGPPGMLHAKARVNTGFAAALQEAGWPGFHAALAKVVEVLERHQWEPFLPPAERGEDYGRV